MGQSDRTAPRPRRVALYSHDTQGLGHIRRNIAVADALVAADPDTDVLLLTGNPVAATLPLPPNTDITTLPTIRKDEDGTYDSRAMSSPLARISAMRSAIVDAALDAFAPDLLIVDKVALGVGDELAPALRTLGAAGDTRIVLGLREILDAPEVAVREWDAARTTQSIERFYDEVWVYGDPTVYDTVTEYRFPASVVSKVVFTGYLGHGRGRGTGTLARTKPTVRRPRTPYALCLVGGGQDGFAVTETFCRTPLPVGHAGIVLTGPFMRGSARAELERLAETNPAMTVAEFDPEPEELIAHAAAVVSMAGYNSVCELLAIGARTLLVPRTAPRAEQVVRARRLADLGLVDMIEPAALSSQSLGSWVQHAVTSAAPAASPINLSGLDAIPALAARLTAHTGGRTHAA